MEKTNKEKIEEFLDYAISGSGELFNRMFIGETTITIILSDPQNPEEVAIGSNHNSGEELLKTLEAALQESIKQNGGQNHGTKAH